MRYGILHIILDSGAECLYNDPVVFIQGDSSMNIEIKKLTPGLAGEYVRFFDETPHDAGIDE